MDRKRYQDHLQTLRQSRPHAEAFLPRAHAHAAAFTDGQRVDDFAAFSMHDYRRRIRLHPDVAWDDACQAYALAAATHPDYGGRLDLDAESRLEAHWEHLRGDSRLDWSIARTLLRETWRWLDGHAEHGATLH